MSVSQHALISKATRAFRNTALLISGTSSNCNAAIHIARAKDDMLIASMGRDEEVEGLYWVMPMFGQTLERLPFNVAIHCIEEMRHFPAKVEQCRSWSKPVYKDSDF